MGVLYCGSAACVSGSLLGMGLLATNKLTYALMLAPVTLSFHAANTMLGSLLTLYVPEEEMGTVLGLSVGTMPLGHVTAILAAAHLYKAHGFAAVPMSAAVLLTGATGFIYLVDLMPPDVGFEEPTEHDAG